MRLDHDEKRRSCYKWDEESAGFRLRRRPHPRKWREALIKNDKQWFRKEAVRGVEGGLGSSGGGGGGVVEGGGVRWKLTPLLTDGEKACCLVCVKESEFTYYSLSDKDSDTSMEKVCEHFVFEEFP